MPLFHTIIYTLVYAKLTTFGTLVTSSVIAGGWRICDKQMYVGLIMLDYLLLCWVNR